MSHRDIVVASTYTENQGEKNKVEENKSNLISFYTLYYMRSVMNCSVNLGDVLPLIDYEDILNTHAKSPLKVMDEAGLGCIAAIYLRKLLYPPDTTLQWRIDPFFFIWL